MLAGRFVRDPGISWRLIGQHVSRHVSPTCERGSKTSSLSHSRLLEMALGELFVLFGQISNEETWKSATRGPLDYLRKLSF